MVSGRSMAWCTTSRTSQTMGVRDEELQELILRPLQGPPSSESRCQCNPSLSRFNTPRSAPRADDAQSAVSETYFYTASLPDHWSALPVPEPSETLFIALGLAALFGFRLLCAGTEGHDGLSRESADARQGQVVISPTHPPLGVNGRAGRGWD